MSKALRIAIFYLPIFVGLALWELAARAGLLNPSLFPSLGETLTAFGRLATRGICSTTPNCRCSASRAAFSWPRSSASSPAC